MYLANSSISLSHLVEHDLSIAVLARRRVPLEANARRTDTDCREILRRTRRYCNRAANRFLKYR